MEFLFAKTVDAAARVQQRVQDGCKSLRNTPGNSESVRQHFQRAVWKRTDRQHFEHFLYCVIRVVNCEAGIGALYRNTLLCTSFHFSYRCSSRSIVREVHFVCVMPCVFMRSVHEVRGKNALWRGNVRPSVFSMLKLEKYLTDTNKIWCGCWAKGNNNQIETNPLKHWLGVRHGYYGNQGKQHNNG